MTSGARTSSVCNSLDERTNLNIAGAVDDIWQMRGSGRLIVVDYKATAKDGQVTLDEAWQDGYKRQMGVYIWLLRKQGFEVEDRGFFLYCNGQDAESFEQRLNFSVSLLPYTGDCDWIEPTLLDLKACLMADDVPPAPHDCEFCGYIAASQGFPAGSIANRRRCVVPRSVSTVIRRTRWATFASGSLNSKNAKTNCERY